MRVLQVLDTYEGGGAQRVALDLGDWLSERGLHVSYIGASGRLEAEFAQRGGSFFRTNCFVLQLLELGITVKRTKPDVIHAHQRREALMAFLVGLLWKCPVVEHAHTFLPDRKFSKLSFLTQAVFAVSTQVAQMIETEFRRRGKVIVVRNAVPIGLALQVKIDDDREHTKLDPLRIINLGRLTEQKDPARFVQIVAALSKRRKVLATWFGEGDLRLEVESLAKALDAPIVFPGFTDDSFRALRDADVLLMTSKWEGMPLVVLEAMTVGCVVATPELSGSLEVVSEDTAIIFGVGDTAGEVAYRVDEACRYPGYETVREKARRSVNVNHSADTQFQIILDQYREVCGT